MPKISSDTKSTTYLSEAALTTATNQQAATGISALRPPLTFPGHQGKDATGRQPSDGQNEGDEGAQSRLNISEAEDSSSVQPLDATRVAGGDSRVNLNGAIRGPASSYGGGGFSSVATRTASTGSVTDSSLVDVSVEDEDDIDAGEGASRGHTQSPDAEGLSSPASLLDSNSLGHNNNNVQRGQLVTHSSISVGDVGGEEESSLHHFLRRPRPTPPPSVSVDGPVGDEYEYDDAMDDGDHTYLTAPSAKAERARQEEEQGSLARNTSSSSLASTAQSSLQPIPFVDSKPSDTLTGSASLPLNLRRRISPHHHSGHRYTGSTLSSDGGFEFPSSVDGGASVITDRTAVASERAKLVQQYQKQQVELRSQRTPKAERITSPDPETNVVLTSTSTPTSIKGGIPHHPLASVSLTMSTVVTEVHTPTHKTLRNKQKGSDGGYDDLVDYGSDTTQPSPPNRHGRATHGSLAPDRPPTPLRKKTVKISEQDIASFVNVDVDDDGAVVGPVEEEEDEDMTTIDGVSPRPDLLLREASDATLGGPPMNDIQSEEHSILLSFTDEGADDQDSVITVRGGSTTVDTASNVHRVTKGSLQTHNHLIKVKKRELGEVGDDSELGRIAELLGVLSQNSSLTNHPAVLGQGSSEFVEVPRASAASETGIIRPVSRYRDTVDLSTLTSASHIPPLPSKQKRASKQKLSATILMNSIAASASVESPFSPIPAYNAAAQFPSYRPPMIPRSSTMRRPSPNPSPISQDFQRSGTVDSLGDSKRDNDNDETDYPIGASNKVSPKNHSWTTFAQVPAQTATTLLDPPNAAKLESQWLHFRKFVSPYESDRSRYKRYPKPTFVNFHPALWRWLVKNASIRRALDLLLLLGFVSAADDDVEQWIAPGRTAPIRFRYVVQEVGVKQVKFDDAIEEPTDERIRELEHEVRELTRQLRMIKSQKQQSKDNDANTLQTTPSLMASPSFTSTEPRVEVVRVESQSLEWGAASVSLTANGDVGDEEGSFMRGCSATGSTKADIASETSRGFVHSPFGDTASQLDGTMSMTSRAGEHQLDVSSQTSFDANVRGVYRKRGSAISEEGSSLNMKSKALDDLSLSGRPKTKIDGHHSVTQLAISHDKRSDVTSLVSTSRSNIVPSIVNEKPLVASVSGNAVVCLEINYLDPDVAPYVVCVSSVGSRWLCPCSIVEHTYVLFVAPAHRRGSVSVSLLCTTDSGSLKRYTKAVWMEYQTDEMLLHSHDCSRMAAPRPNNNAPSSILHSVTGLNALMSTGGPLSRHAVNQLRAEVPLPSSVTLPDPSERSEVTSGIGDFDDFNSDNVSVSASEPRLPLTREALDMLSIDPMNYLRQHLRAPSLTSGAAQSPAGPWSDEGRGGRGSRARHGTNAAVAGDDRQSLTFRCPSVAGSQGTQFVETAASLISSSPTGLEPRHSEQGSES